MKYISVSFLPGSAGDFFSRCLNMLSNAYCFADRATKKIPVTIEEKLSILNYDTVINKNFNQRNWVDFESQVIRSNAVFPHHKLPDNSYSIWLGHPIDIYGGTNLSNIAGPKDQCYNLYINSGVHFEWGILNALYKNSVISSQYFINAKILLNDINVYKINLDSFIQGWEPFCTEFKKTCDYIGHDNITSEEIQAVKILYTQWRTTVLEYKDLNSFKKIIGFDM
jgi:hypothetical protein